MRDVEALESYHEKQRKRKELEEQVADFLGTGGEIEKPEPQTIEEIKAEFKKRSVWGG